MILDKQNLFSDAQSLAGTGNILSTNAIDLGVAGALAKDGTSVRNDLGRGEEPKFFAQVVTDVSGGTSVQVQLVQADDAALSANLEVLQQTDAVAVASLKAGYQFRIGRVPAGVSRRYLGLRYVVVGTITSGAATAGMILDRFTNINIG